MWCGAVSDSQCCMVSVRVGCAAARHQPHFASARLSQLFSTLKEYYDSVSSYHVYQLCPSRKYRNRIGIIGDKSQENGK